MSKIKNTEDLREFLCDAITSVADGVMDAEKARGIVKLSAQVNESLYSEAKIAKLQLELNKQAASFGKLNLGRE